MVLRGYAKMLRAADRDAEANPLDLRATRILDGERG
jgi:hypothetical protein